MHREQPNGIFGGEFIFFAPHLTSGQGDVGKEPGQVWLRFVVFIGRHRVAQVTDRRHSGFAFFGLIVKSGNLIRVRGSFHERHHCRGQ